MSSSQGFPTCGSAPSAVSSFMLYLLSRKPRPSPPDSPGIPRRVRSSLWRERPRATVSTVPAPPRSWLAAFCYARLVGRGRALRRFNPPTAERKTVRSDCRLETTRQADWHVPDLPVLVTFHRSRIFCLHGASVPLGIHGVNTRLPTVGNDHVAFADAIQEVEVFGLGELLRLGDAFGKGVP